MCDDGFSNNSASAICKEMGYRTSKNWTFGEKWSVLQNLYSIKLDDVICTAPFWTSCSYAITHNCKHGEDVFLSCILSCPSGYYRESGSNSCVRCPADTYSEGIQTSCTDCPGSSTSDPGSSYCSCESGMFWNNTGCNNCTEISVSQEGALQCIDCPLNVTMNNGLSCRCPEGMVWSWDGKIIESCKLCLPGTYKNEEGTSCITCPLGTTSGIGYDHCTCTAGRFWNKTKCESCAHSVSQEGSLKCQECPLNSIPGSENIICICPEGQSWIWDGLGIGSCKYILLSSQNGISPLAWFSGVLIIIIVTLAILLVYERRQKRKEEFSATRVKYNVDKGNVHTVNGQGETSEVQTQEEGTVISNIGEEEMYCVMRNVSKSENVYDVVDN